MKKMLLFTGCAVFSSSLLFAQSITSANFVRPAAFVDTFYEASATSVITASVGVNQTWDYSSLVPTGNFGSITLKDAGDSTTGYPQVLQFDDDISFDGLQASSPAAEFFNVNSAGYYPAAYYINGLSEPLSSVTGTPGDELVIPQQRITYNDSLFYLKFPVTAQSSWSSSRRRDAQFNATIASAGLNQTPGSFTEIITETRTVVGSGQVIIPDENGNPLPAIDAFLIEVNSATYDSTFLAGAPAPPALLATFNLPQGLRSTLKRYLLYPSNGGENPIVSYSVDANDAITSFVYRPRAARVALSVSLAENVLNRATLYPNPLSAGKRLTVEHDNPAEVAQVKIYNVQGAYLASYKAEALNDKAVTFTPQLAAGLYLVNLVGHQGEILSGTKLQVQ